MHTKINIVKKLSGAYHKVWYEKSVLPGLNISVYNTGIRFVLEPRTRTNTTWIFSFFSHSTLPLPVTSSLVGAAASYLLPHWKRNVQKTRREIAFVLSFTDFWSYHDASDSNAVQSGKREERKKNMKKTLKVSNSFSRYRTYPKLHMMHICTMGYIRIIPD